ncbi:MAG: zinc ribbon domain-containing protein [Ruminococcus flavefaciens]|nr:zinc ribbon domain-containing protein [Ruminococcus flavefaciens]MCM1228894.1 zinc ribbon domain-containing protein [Ruminococcus flavefaciens]
MFCKKCGREIKDGATFCSECGAVVENISGENNQKPEDTNNLFFSPDEREIAVLGSSFMINYISDGQISNGSCVLSDRRVYFKGKCYSREGGRLVKTVEASTVDIKDVTASGFSYSSKAGIFILGCFLAILTFIMLIFFSTFKGFFFLGLLATIATFIVHSFTKVKLFYIAFAGGKIAFRASDYSSSEIQRFQKKLRLTIDAYIEKSV